MICENYIRADKLEWVVGLYKDLVDHTRKEAGCIYYNVYQDESNPLLIIFIEEWSNEEALNNHMKNETFIKIFSEIESCFTQNERIKRCKEFIPQA